MTLENPKIELNPKGGAEKTEKEGLQEEKESDLDKELKEIKPSDYLNLGEDLKEWIDVNEELPIKFWDKVQDANKEDNLQQLLSRIGEDLDDFYKKNNIKKRKAKSFVHSRFTSLEEIIAAGVTSCGSDAKIYGTILRKFGIPVQFIHGILESQKRLRMLKTFKENRHAWLKVYNPKDGEWLIVDPSQKGFKTPIGAEEVKIYHNWEELKEDYEKGNF